jgi:hypothetical protein
MVFVECPLLVAHALVVFPRLGDHHHHGLRQRAPTQSQKFETVVEFSGVTTVLLDDGEELVHIVPKQIGG